ncbi:MAG: ATP-binding cassette domain-containing protein [Fibromonadales bacterium]|nr:ATP-binding cassette domain-containing protein [Fibromonadales bacterium]
MSLKQLLKNVWLYSWVLIVPLSVLASFTDLLLLGGIRLLLLMLIESQEYILNINFLKNLGTHHWLFMMVLIIALRYLFITLRARSEERLNHKLESHLRAWWIRIVKNLHPLQFHKPGIDGVLHNANISVSTLPKGCKIVTHSIQAVSQLLFFIPVLFILSWKLTIVLLFIFAPIVLYLQRTIKKTGKDIDEFNMFSGDYDSNLWRWSALRKCWNNHAELSKYLSMLFGKIRNLRNASTEIGVRDATITQTIETISILVMCVVLAICAVLIEDRMVIVLFCVALFICYKPLKDCSQLFSNLRDLRRAYAGLTCLEDMEHTEKFFTTHDEDCIKIEEMAFQYGDYEPWIFQSLNNTIKLNRPLILQGENGCGKTTLLRILSGLEIPQNGNIYMPPKAKSGSFYLSQRLFLPPIFWLEQEIKGKEWSSTIRNLFDALGLENLLKKNGHSNGELQRIGLAWAVVSGRPFLFLDEPFAYISQDLQEPVFKAFWNATTETDQWWMMATHIPLPQTYKERVVYWKL